MAYNHQYTWRFLVFSACLRSGCGAMMRGRSGEGTPPLEQGVKRYSRSTEKPGLGGPQTEDPSMEGVGTNGNGRCATHFLPENMSVNMTQKCVDLIGLRMDHFPPKEEDLVKVDYQDKCFAKCYLTELGYMTPDDTFNNEAMAQDIKDSTPLEKHSSRIQTLEMCRKDTESRANEIGGLSRSPCKFALIFFACARKAERELVC